MRRFLALSRLELEMTFSRRSRRLSLALIVFALILPLLFVFAGDGAKPELNPVSIAIVDSSGESLMAQIREELGKLDLIDQVYDVSKEEAKRLLDTDEIALYFDFPESFIRDTFSVQERSPIKVYLNPMRATESEYFARFADEVSIAIAELEASFFAYSDLVRPLYDNYFLFNRKMDLTVVEIFMRVLARNRNVTSTAMPAFDMFSHLVTSGLITLTLFFSLLPLTYARRDKENGLERRFISLGLSLSARRFSRLLAALPWFAATLFFVTLVLRFGFQISVSPQSFFLLTGLWLTVGLLFELFGRRFSHGASASLAAVTVVFTLLLTGGILYPRTLLPNAVASIGSWFPSGQVQNAVFEQLKSSSDQKLLPVLAVLLTTSFTIILADLLMARRGEA